MAITTVDPSNQISGHCDWCKRPLEEGKFQQYGPNYHICDSCTLTFGQRASVVIESNPDLADQVGSEIESQIEHDK